MVDEDESERAADFDDLVAVGDEVMACEPRLQKEF